MNPHLQQILHDITVRITKLEEAQQPQRTWVDLSTIQILDIFAETVRTHGGGSMPDGQIAFAKAIQAKLKEKNT